MTHILHTGFRRHSPGFQILLGWLLLSLLVTPVTAMTTAPFSPTTDPQPSLALQEDHQPETGLTVSHDTCQQVAHDCCQNHDCGDHGACASHCMNNVNAWAIVPGVLNLDAAISGPPALTLKTARLYFHTLPQRPPRAA